MAEQLLEAVLALPADVNVFDFVLSEIGSQVYPRMSDGFWTQAHIATGAMGLGILMSVATLLIRARKGRLSWFIHDGPAIVRPSPKTWVPLFWSITAASMIVLTALLERDIKTRHLTAEVGRFWWFTPATLIVPFAVVWAGPVTSSPRIRRWLVMFNGAGPGGHLENRSTRSLPSIILLNSILLVGSIVFMAGIVPAMYYTGSQFALAQEGYEQVVRVVEAARAANDMSQLFLLSDALAVLVKSLWHSELSEYPGGGVYSFFFLITAIWPAYSLMRTIQSKVARLEDGQSSAPSPSCPEASFDTATHLSIHIPLQSRGEPHNTDQPRLPFKPQLPKDRPFTNLAATSSVPNVYQHFLDGSFTSSEKAKRLRQALARENALLATYAGLLLAMTSNGFWHATGLSQRLPITQDLSIAWCWEIYSFAVPYLALSCILLRDAVRHVTTDSEMANITATSRTGQSAWMVTGHQVSTIQLSQTVIEVVEEGQLGEKKHDYRRYA